MDTDVFPVVASIRVLLPKSNVCEPERHNDFRNVKPFVLMSVNQIKTEYSSSDSSRPRALACLGFWRVFLNTLWNVNFTTVRGFPVMLNADFFVKQRHHELCM